MRDPRVRDVTLTRVEMTEDLREATVFFTPLGRLGDASRAEELRKGLSRAAAFLQGKVGRSLRLRNTPRLTFRYDKGVDNLAHMHDVLSALGADAPREADGDEPDDG